MLFKTIRECRVILIYMATIFDNKQETWWTFQLWIMLTQRADLAIYGSRNQAIETFYKSDTESCFHPEPTESIVHLVADDLAFLR